MKTIQSIETKLLKSIPLDAEIPEGWELVVFDFKIENTIPQIAKNMKFRLSLIKAGISLKNINDAINSMPESPQKEQILTLWEFAEYFERNDKTLISMAQSLGISSEQLDNLFILANETI